MKMIIEPNPCETCDFSPRVCDTEIEYCMQYGNYNKRVEDKIKQQQIDEICELNW